MIYSLMGIIGIIVVLAINFDVLFDKRYVYRNKAAFYAYRFLIIMALVFFAVDIAWGFLDGVRPVIFVEIDTALYFISMAVRVLAWFRFVAKYLGHNGVITHIFIALGYLFLAAGLTLVIINFFHPVLFSYDTDVYVTKLGRDAYLITQMAMYLLASIFAFVMAYRNRQKTIEHQTIGFAGLVMAIAVLLQYFYPFIPAYALGYLACLALVHSFIVVSSKQKLLHSLAEGEKREEEQSKQLESAQELAYKDSLTGAKNKHAYVEFEARLDVEIREKQIKEFSIFIFDLNDLKLTNDTYGHEMGDKYIIKSYNLIKQFFPNSDIYRYGGDEFVVFVSGDAYQTRFKALDDFNKVIDENLHTNEPIVASGFSDFVPEKDNTLRAVFTRADDRMYSRKRNLKELNVIENEKSEENQIIASSLERRYRMYEMFYHSRSISLMDMLNGSNCDELVEVDIVNDTFKQFYHVEGKYFVPAVAFSYKELLDFSTKHVVHPDDVGIFLGLMKIDGFFERLKNARIPYFEIAHFRYKLQDGEYRYVEQAVIAGKENGIPEGTFRMYVFDINNMKMRQMGKIGDETGVISVGRNEITGLLSGKEFYSKANRLIEESEEKELCLVSMDIEHFKFFGEWFGREKGDVLLATLGSELGKIEVETGGVAGYFGQDDFVILMKYDMSLIERMYAKARSIIDSFGFTGGLLPAFGVAIIEKGMTAVEAVDRANLAVSKAKNDIKNRISVYNTDMQFLVEQEYRILTDSMKALQNQEFTFYLQPQIRISNTKFAGAEALVRWVKQDGSVIPPGVFIPILEKYGFIPDLDKYVWEKVCSWIKEMLTKGKPIVPISVNVSRVDIYSMDIAEFFHSLCEKYDVPHRYIKIEITESAYAETTNTIDELVNRLQKDGFMVLMDDFGSGYSSLNMLSGLKLDAIKMDADFLKFKNDKEKENGIHILESVINMAKMMALPIVMEGVETKEQCDFLAGLGCQFVQGYYYYAPMPIPKFEILIADGNLIDDRGFTAKANEQFRIREFLDKNIYSDSMLNSVIGAVAIYLWHDDHVDIIRYNQQFYQDVNVPNFTDRLVNMDQFLPEEDRPLFFKTLKEARDDKLNGATAIFRFSRLDGTMMSFRIHFYYLGKIKEGHRFYGSAINVTELTDLQDSMKLLALYSNDNMIFITKVNGAWRYQVASHGLSDIMGLSPSELEQELNNGNFARRVISQKDLKQFMKDAESYHENGENFERVVSLYDKNHQKVNIELKFTFVKDKSNNIDYILKTRLIEKN